MSPSETLHATTVAIGGRAVLLMGPSGSGKSDLALRLVDRGAVLVSDDYTIVTRIGDLLRASSPERLVNRIEVRGIGIITVKHHSDVPVSLVLNLAAIPDRMPDALESKEIAGIGVPVLPLSPWEVSAPIKVELALKAFGLATDGHDSATAS